MMSPSRSWFAWEAPALPAATSEHLATIKDYVQAQGLNASVRLSGRLCQDFCKQGPNLSIGGEPHHQVTPEGLRDLLQQLDDSSSGRRWSSLTQSTRNGASAMIATSASASVLSRRFGFRTVMRASLPELCMQCGNCIVVLSQQCQARARRPARGQGPPRQRPQSYRLAGAVVCGAVRWRAPGAVDPRSQTAWILRRL